MLAVTIEQCFSNESKLRRFKPKHKYVAKYNREIIGYEYVEHSRGFWIFKNKYIECDYKYYDSYKMYKEIPYPRRGHRGRVFIKEFPASQIDDIRPTMQHKFCKDILKLINDYDSKGCFTNELKNSLMKAQKEENFTSFYKLVEELEDRLDEVEGLVYGSI